MNRSIRRSLATLALLATSLGVRDVQGQGKPAAAPLPPVGGCPRENLAFHRCAIEKAKTFAPSRTPSGKPNLQGYWRPTLVYQYSLEGVSGTERSLGDQEPWPITAAPIIDPPDRKIPYQPWAARVGRIGENVDKYIDPRGACGPGGVPRIAGATVGGLVHDPNQILQPPGDDHIVWLFEDHQFYRVIEMNGRPAPGASIKLRLGHSQGRWDSNTLVIDVTNLNGYTWLDDSGNFYTDTAHLVERLTLIDPDTIHYEVTFEDPRAYTRPWKVAWALVRDKTPGFEILEEACWEGDRDLPHAREAGFQYYLGQPWKNR